ncbi:MAG: glycosyltransferase family 2 protein [Candidatus Riflebacteria bacterium]|nr:glycosyltransferase family 2 protein [Candidatus Riflebacteria bacterium]
MPKVTVIVPNYNHGRFLEKRIDSILQQTFQDLEIIVLDDCSSDNSREIIDFYKKQFPQIRTHYNEKNSGSPFQQWDLGIQKSIGEFIWIAESDDFADREFLSCTVPILENNPKVGLVNCESRIVDETNQITTNHFYNQALLKKRETYFNCGMNEILSDLYTNCGIVNVSAVLLRKKYYFESGKVDTSMKFCGDWLLYIKMLMISDIAYLRKPLNYWRIHSNSSFHKYFQDEFFLKESLIVYRYLYDRVPIDPQKQKNISHRLANLLLMQIKRKGLPSKKLFRQIKKIDPFFELRTILILVKSFLHNLFQGSISKLKNSLLNLI